MFKIFKSQRFFRLWKKILRVINIMKRDYKAYLGGSIILVILIAAAFAPYLAPASPYATDVTRRLAGPSRQNLLGTDSLGRDILSRLIYAARPAMMVAFGAIIISVIIGIVTGLLAAYSGGVFDTIVIFIFDVVRAFPPIILILVLLSVVGPSLASVIIILGITTMPRYGRVVRAETLSEKAEDYVESARSLGANNSRIIFKHIFPNIFASVLVLSGMDMASMIMWEAGISFLGLGLQPPLSSWGVMLQESYQYIQTAPLMILWPSLAIILTMLGFSTFAESLRIALNPKTGQEE